MSGILASMIQVATEKQREELDGFLEKYIRLNAKPKIEGEITKGKLYLRDIQINVYKGNNGIFPEEYEVMQRGEIISPRFVMKKVCRDT